MFDVAVVSITSIRTKKTYKTVDEPCVTVEDLLEANKGATVDLLTADLASKSNEWISGKLVSVNGTRQNSDDGATVTNDSPSPFPIRTHICKKCPICVENEDR